jgi:hypothetical protein
LVKWKFPEAEKNILVAVSYLRKGFGRIENLNVEAEKIWELCLKNNIVIEDVVYIPSKENKIADQLSRRKIGDIQDWGISTLAFKELDKEFGPLTIDIYANRENKKLERYREFVRSRDALGLSIDTWRREDIYCCPPIGMVLKTLIHIIKYQLEAVLVVPEWKTNLYYPILLKIKTKEMKIQRNQIIGKQNSEIHRNQRWKLIVVKVEGKRW